MMTARIAGIGAYVPENLITNDDLAKIVDTNDEWIRTRTGIRERRISSGEGTRHLAAKAAERALAAAGVAPEELDIIILGTSSPDRNYPSDACSVQAAIGAVNAVAFDISAACAGFIFAMNIVEGFFKAGIYKTALIIGAETLSKVTGKDEQILRKLHLPFRYRGGRKEESHVHVHRSEPLKGKRSGTG